MLGEELFGDYVSKLIMEDWIFRSRFNGGRNDDQIYMSGQKLENR